MMKEIWKPVRGKEDWAEISNYGQVHYYATGKGRYPDERFTYGSENNEGYLRAKIGGVKKGVHVWVYLTFVGDIPKGMEVNHIDENKHNNCVWNLNLMTRKENMRWGTGIERRAAANKNNPKRSKAVQALNPKTLEVVMEFPSTREAKRQGFNQGAVSQCCRNCFNRPGNNVYKGFIWRYKFV